MIEEYRTKIKEATDFIKSKINIVPEYALILGSGLGDLANEVENKVVIPYAEIPNFPKSTAPGHAGNFVFGTLSGKPVAIMQGRFHLYEGYSPREVALPVRVMKSLGVKVLIATCATGGLNRNFKAGDIMLISDHINLTSLNPLTGPNDPEMGDRFPVMFGAYDTELRELAKNIALKDGVYLQSGVYAGITGPAFTTRSELRYLITLGADSVGMSVVQEVIAARHSDIKVLGIGTITDMALPDSPYHAGEEEILETANKVGPIFKKLIKSVLAEI